MFKDAVKACIPLIAAQIEDTVYAGPILEDLCGQKFQKVSGGDTGLKEGGLYYYLSRTGKGADDPPKLYERFRAANATFVYLNQDNPPSEFLDVGLLVPTPPFLKKQLQAVVEAHQMPIVLPALGGLSVKDAITVVKVAKARHKDITAETVVETRRNLIRTSQGLTLIDPYLPAYTADKTLKKFVESEKKWFLSGTESRLRPRGMLFDGPPGTGKTLGAKYIANAWGVPLFRLDATFQNKYVGQSEGNISQALRRVESAEPCLFLLDEIEKFFAGHASGGGDIMVRVMGELLWWLQEHQSRVLTIMTTNKRTAIPPELYREGRIDKVIEFERMTDQLEIAAVATNVLVSFMGDENDDHPELVQLILKMADAANQDHDNKPLGISPAQVTQLVKSLIKKIGG